MLRPQCPPEEDVLRAITTPDWDIEEGRIQHGFFENRGKAPDEGVSVSRLSMYSRVATIEIFRKELRAPLLGVAEINVGALQKIGKEYDKGPVAITVEHDPTPNNPAHAIIPQKITRGLSGKIREYLEEHHLVERW